MFYWFVALLMFLAALLYAGQGTTFFVGVYGTLCIMWAGLALFRMMYLDR